MPGVPSAHPIENDPFEESSAGYAVSPSPPLVAWTLVVGLPIVALVLVARRARRRRRVT